MLVINDICKKCKIVCNSIHFQRNFKNWTSGNNDVDKLIQNIQLSVHHKYVSDVIEWIPYEKFYEFRCIAEDEFGVYRANWIKNKIYWSYYTLGWIRNQPVVLKILNNPEVLHQN
jgi:hypothetical protein